MRWPVDTATSSVGSMGSGRRSPIGQPSSWRGKFSRSPDRKRSPGGPKVDNNLAVLLGQLPEPDMGAVAIVRERAARVLRPAGALARLDEVAIWLAGWQRTTRPRVEAPAAVVFVANHGVAAEGVSAYSADVTEEMLRALRSEEHTSELQSQSNLVCRL